MKIDMRWAAAGLLSLLPLAGAAKPIAFAKGTTVMLEYGAGTMNEAQLFYAPRYWYSLGGGWLELQSEDGAKQRHITYARANLLAKRWNLPGAQANVFVWGGLGSATGNDFAGTTWRATSASRPTTKRAASTRRCGRICRRVTSSPTGSTPCSWAGRRTSTTTTPWPPGWSFKVADTRAISTGAPRRPCCSASSRVAPGWKSVQRPTANCRPWPCSTSKLENLT